MLRFSANRSKVATKAGPQEEYAYAYTFVAEFGVLGAFGRPCKASRCLCKKNQKVSIRNSVKNDPRMLAAVKLR